jgi:hypothetical protein
LRQWRPAEEQRVLMATELCQNFTALFIIIKRAPSYSVIFPFMIVHIYI